MKQCDTQGCTKSVDDKYRYCLEHSKTTETTKKWNDDPLIDVLLKINHNLNGIRGSLLTIAYNTAKEEDDQEPTVQEETVS